MQRKFISGLILVTFIFNLLLPYQAQAQTVMQKNITSNLLLPVGAGSLPVLKGLRIDPKDPLRINFIIDTGMTKAVSKDEAAKLIRYFLAGLTIPAQDLWVNLSPYEQNRIVEPSLGDTDLGKDMLALDYVLKQMAASLTYPETELGKKYWSAITGVRHFSGEKVSDTAFNKVWIVPATGKVYEHKDLAVIADAKMKAMVESDYLAQQNYKSQIADYKLSNDNINAFKTHILPVINKEINEGKNFAQLRQVYSSLVLATWFKKKFEQSFYRHYINQKQIAGIEIIDKTAKDKIWQQYVEAFKKGAYNYVKKEVAYPSTSSFDKLRTPLRVPAFKKITKRAYFSGGEQMGPLPGVVSGEAASGAAVEALPHDGPLVEAETAAGDSSQTAPVVPSFEQNVRGDEAERQMIFERATAALGHQPEGGMDGIAFQRIFFAHRMHPELTLGDSDGRGNFHKSQRMLRGIAYYDLDTGGRAESDSILEEKISVAMRGWPDQYSDLTPEEEMAGWKLAQKGALGNSWRMVNSSSQEFPDLVYSALVKLLGDNNEVHVRALEIADKIVFYEKVAVTVRSPQDVINAISVTNSRKDSLITIGMASGGDCQILRKNVGGLSMADLSEVVGVSANSLPVELPAVDGKFFAHFDLPVISLKPIKSFTASVR